MSSRIDPHRALLRLLFAVAAGGATTVALSHKAGAFAGLAGWNAACVVLLVLSWLPILSADAAATQRRAASDDPGRTFVYALVITASAVSLFAALLFQRRARELPPGDASLMIWLCLSSVALAWSLTHSAFTLRYARLYYREDAEGVGGVEFPGGHRPTYFDFAYVAFTLGMCFQVSDASISSPQIRRAVLLHAVISFAYNTAIIAFVLNLVFSSAL